MTQTDEFIEHFEKPENRETYGWVQLAFDEYPNAEIDKTNPQVQSLVEEAKKDYWKPE